MAQISFILMGIVLTATALWVDYAGRRIDTKAKENPEYDRDTELQAARNIGLVSLFALILAALAGGAEARKDHPLLHAFSFLLAIIIQSQIQFSLEKKIRGIQATQTDNLNIALRGLFIMIASIFGYALTVAGMGFVFGFVAHLLGQPAGVVTVATLFGTFLGILTALTLSFAIAPYTMRKMLPLRPLQEDAKQNMIKNCFAQAGLAPPETWVIEIDQFRSANAMIAGFTRGKGPFKPALFITKTLLEHFPEEEIKAVVLHEVSHLAFNHLRQRFVLGFLSVIGATLSMALFILVAPKFATLGLLISMAMPFILMRQQNQRQELEADREAILKFGASFEGLAGALRRIDQLNNPQLKLSGGHPATERRLILIRQAAEEALITEEFKRTLEQELIKQPKSNKQKAA